MVSVFTQSANLYITADISCPTCSLLHRTHNTNRAPLNAHKTNIVREVATTSAPSSQVTESTDHFQFCNSVEVLAELSF